mgnify:FL=1
MKRKINSLVCLVLGMVFFIPVGVVYKKMGMGIPLFALACLVVASGVLFAYRRLWSRHTFDSPKGGAKFAAVVGASFLFCLYVFNVLYISHKVYQSLLSSNDVSFSPTEYAIDDTLGIKHVPLARTLYRYNIRDNIPSRPVPLAFDENGFRIPVSASAVHPGTKKIGLLFLGDSFTFGAACYAEETFPFLVAKATGRSYVNAGVSNYGLAQMLILAEQLIPALRPEYVIVQYSPWLATRGISMFAPVNFFLLPIPYFAEKNNTYVVEPPVYNSHLKFRDVAKLKASYRGKFLQFFVREALPFSLEELWNYLKTEWLLISGQRLRPATHPRNVEKYAFNKIKTITEQNHATLVILNLGDLEYSKNSRHLFSDATVRFAEADDALDAFLRTSASKDYCAEFCHWIIAGQQRILIDAHPNPRAHQIIAQSVIQAIGK